MPEEIEGDTSKPVSTKPAKVPLKLPGRKILPTKPSKPQVSPKRRRVVKSTTKASIQTKEPLKKSNSIRSLTSNNSNPPTPSNVYSKRI